MESSIDIRRTQTEERIDSLIRIASNYTETWFINPSHGMLPTLARFFYSIANTLSKEDKARAETELRDRGFLISLTDPYYPLSSK